MKPLFKYPATLLILMLVGYTQVFAHVYRVEFYTPAKKSGQIHHYQAPVEKSAGVENYLFEEEEENRRDDNVSFDFLCTDLSEFYFDGLTCASQFRAQLSGPFLSKSPLFRVLRL